VLIRRATTADAAALARFAERTFVETYSAQNTPDDMVAYVSATFGEAHQRAELEDAARVTLLGEMDGTLVAYAQIRPGAPPACVHATCALELARFYVDGAWHGRGVAHALMDAVHDAARARGGDVLWLRVWERNARAIAFYRRCGFVDAGMQTFRLGRDVQRDRVMRRAVRRSR